MGDTKHNPRSAREGSAFGDGPLSRLPACGYTTTSADGKDLYFNGLQPNFSWTSLIYFLLSLRGGLPKNTYSQGEELAASSAIFLLLVICKFQFSSLQVGKFTNYY